MSIKKRNMLCIKDKDKLNLGERLLYEPYKNILNRFVELATEKGAAEFDPISRTFDGLDSISHDLKHYYEALLGVTSYYQHSQGGRGKYVEKRFSSIVNSCSLNIKLSELPLWLHYPDLHRKKGIFTQNGLSRKEKEKLRRTEWDFIGWEDETTDLGNILRKNKTIVLVELKNRVDSGGTAARREIWTKKFKIILNLLTNQEIKIYRRKDKMFSLIELLKEFQFERLEIYIGILFNVDGTPATKQGDKERGFYSSNEEGYKDLKRTIGKSEVKVIKEDFNKLEITLLFKDFEIRFGALYGDEITERLFRKKYSLNDLLVLRYDDIWLGQLTAISERTFLLKYGKNYMSELKEVIKRDWNVRKLYDAFITSEGDESNLIKLVEYLLQNHSKSFSSALCQKQRQQDEYLSDIIWVLASSES